MKLPITFKHVFNSRGKQIIVRIYLKCSRLASVPYICTLVCLHNCHISVLTTARLSANVSIVRSQTVASPA